jgi:hypothetical protein
MMRTPSEFQLEQLMHAYDAAKAREYYLRTRKLKGRKKGSDNLMVGKKIVSGPQMGQKKMIKPKRSSTKQKKLLQEQIKNLEGKLVKLEKLIRTKMREEASEDRKGKAKKERAAKESDKPDTAAEKAENARENKKYREKNQQKLKSDSKKDDSGGGSSSKDSKKSSSGPSVSSLKSLATKVRGQISVAKQKLATL